MSPSEEKGMRLGIALRQFDKCSTTFADCGAPMSRNRFFAKFSVDVRGRRHELRAYSKSRAGAWRVAVRWLRLLQNRKLK